LLNPFHCHSPHTHPQSLIITDPSYSGASFAISTSIWYSPITAAASAHSTTAAANAAATPKQRGHLV